MENNQLAARAARRFLTDRVRDDWDWPTTPGAWSASDEEVRNITEFRERYYGTTSPEPEPESEAGAGEDPYKFDSPDSIGNAVEEKKQKRKRKRREMQEKEMAWNEGLLCFVQRRDVWTGAASVKKYGRRDQMAAEAHDHDAAQAPDAHPPPPTETAIPPPDISSVKNDPADPLIPIALPMLADNSIRQSIKPRAYPDIFNNIVIAGRSPSVPINLADMTRALVVGWKENGEWPPKAGPLDPLAGRKRGPLVNVKPENGEFLAHHPHMKKGMDSVKRMFHLNGHQDHGTPENHG